jgi:hypothetical protein
LAVLAAGAACLMAQDSRTVVDNDQVRVLVVNQPPHKKTALHEHKVNRVMIYLEPGSQNLDYQDGKRVVNQWKAGEAKWSPASGMHVAEITSGQPVTIVEIELKKPGDPARTATGPLDPVKLDAKDYKVLFENDQVRVLRARIGVGKSTPVHEHLLNRVTTYLTEVKLRVTTPDGASQTVERKPGEVAFAGPAKHKEENLSPVPFEVVAVELKN